MEPGSELFGKAFENWVYHELCAYNVYRERFADFYYWQLSGGTEVDFIVNHIDCAIECKTTARICGSHLKGLRQLMIEHPETKRRIVVCLETKDWKTEDGIEVMKLLWNEELF